MYLNVMDQIIIWKCSSKDFSTEVTTEAWKSQYKQHDLGGEQTQGQGDRM